MTPETTTGLACAFTWSYAPATGIITLTSNNAIFASGTNRADIFVVM